MSEKVSTHRPRGVCPFCRRDWVITEGGVLRAHKCGLTHRSAVVPETDYERLEAFVRAIEFDPDKHAANMAMACELFQIAPDRARVR